MPTLQTCGTGIDVQQSQTFVILHLQDVAVAGNEQLGRTSIDLLPDAGIVPAGITADVRHQHVGTFTVPAQHQWEHASQVAPVAIATYSPQGTNLLQSHGQFHRTDVAGMPYLVTLLEVLAVAVVPPTVRITQQSNPLHFNT